MRCWRVLSSLAVLSLAACATAVPFAPTDFTTEPAYNYPINNPYAATVIGTPPDLRTDYSKLPEPENEKITIFPDRKIPEGFWYEHELKYSQLLQAKPAPLVYVVAGMGADAKAEKMRTIADILYTAGFSVVLLPSPTDPNFIINAGENFTPGRPIQDAKDLYRVMQIIDAKISTKTKITERMLTGYSLGAMDAAFTAKLDDEQKHLNFSKVLLINPPYNLYNSMTLLDKMLFSALPNGINDVGGFIKNMLLRLSSVNQSGDALDFSNERLLIEAYNKYKPSDNRLATMIGLSFRLSAANMIFTADVMSHAGYIFPKNQEFTTSTHLNDYMAIALRTGYINYFNDMYSAKYIAENPGFTKTDLIAESSLQYLAPYLANNKKFALITNADDIILTPEDLNALKNLFGDNAAIFANGGHVGNLAHPAVAYHIVKFLKGEPW